MRLIHTGDWHFEEAKHRRAGADAMDEGWHDVASAFDALVNDALTTANIEPTVFVFGGDLARTRKPSPHTYRHVAAGLRRLDAAGIPTIMIPGNHDIAAKGEANALDPLGELPGVHLFNEPGIAWLSTSPSVKQQARVWREHRGDVDAAIVCMPWVHRGAAAANAIAEGDSLLEQIALAITTTIRGMVVHAREVAGADVPILLLYHGTVAGASTATGRAAHLFHEPVISPHDLDGMGLAGVMLNHIHKAQALTSSRPDATPILYSSSIERLTFSDENDTKGWLDWQTVPGQVANVGPVPTPNARRFVTMTSWVPQEPGDVDDAIVRVRLPAEMLDETWTEQEIREELLAAGAHAVPEVVFERGDERVQHEAADLARTDPIEALDRWLRTEVPDAGEDEMTELLAMGGELTGVPRLTPEQAEAIDDEVRKVFVDDVDITPYVTEIEIDAVPNR